VKKQLIKKYGSGLNQK